MTISFHIRGLDAASFVPLFALSDADLIARSMRRAIADAPRVAPCRVTLDDAAPGERLILLPYAHHAAHSPYHASGPIYVRESAAQAFDRIDELPPVFAGRLLSVRAYDESGMMRDADVVDSNPRALFDRFFADPLVSCLHVHYARRGCFAARVDRAL
jgi:hypothetical protein